MYNQIIYHTIRKLSNTIFKDEDFTIKMENEKELISRLKFIGKIKRGQKVDVNVPSVQDEGLTTSIYRTLNHQCNRKNTITFIIETVKRCIEIVNNKYKGNKEYNTIYENILNDLYCSKIGICNVKQTYNDDLKICCDMDTLIQDIDTFLLECNFQGTDKEEELLQ